VQLDSALEIEQVRKAEGTKGTKEYIERVREENARN
jgi:hypothetical protein